MITPQVHYTTIESLRAYYCSGYRCKSSENTKYYKSYRELKKDLKNILEVNIDDEGVFVVRSRRGEWGEWFERWKLIGGKPTIVKQGWS